MDALYIFLAIATVWVIWTYNRFVTLRYRAKEALSDIDVQTKRRYDLIPNLVDTVKGYMTHEKSVLENVTKARADVVGMSGDQIDKAEAENMLSSTLKTLFAVAENYPDLKANANFLDLQRELADTENKIQAARRFYNTTVRDLNIKIDIFPSNLIANLFRFNKEKFFETEVAAEKEPVKVSF
ncbi:MAG TPA: LemA family protein [Candidatus Paceibacterota bacterium]